jgi:hypothetical protein
MRPESLRDFGDLFILIDTPEDEVVFLDFP